MSGHSKWSSIKHQKAVTDARRGQLFTKLTKEIIVAARQDGADPDMNFRLRMAIQKAKEKNMPADNIARAVKRGTGDGSAQDRMDEIVYEGYGPGGTAILLQTLTDNRNRTGSDVRATFTKAGGNLAEVGTVAWQFQQKGVVVVEAGPGQTDDLALVAIDADADDFEPIDSALHVYCAPERLDDVRKALEEHGASVESFEISMVPNSTITLNESTAMQNLRLLDRLEELDDIQRVFSNADFPDEALERYRNED